MGCTLFCCLLMLSAIPLLVEGQVFIKPMYRSQGNVKDSVSVRKDWESLENSLKNLVNGAIKMVLPGLIDTMQRSNISSRCVGQAVQVLGGIRKLETWAMRFLDSTAKGVDGIITGTSFNYGAYGECMDTVATAQRTGRHKEEVMFTGKYCLLMIQLSLPEKKSFYKPNEIIEELKKFKNGTILGDVAKYVPYLYTVPTRLGLCVPSGCSEYDINLLLANVAHDLGLNMNVNRCEVKEETKFTPMMTFVISMYSLVGFIVLLATAIDIYCCYAERKLYNMYSRILLSFSFISNFRKFTDTSTSSKSLSCMNGIRFITMSWIILGHSYVLNILHLAGEADYVRSQTQEFAVQVLMNAVLAVDTFFFLGGFLVCYLSTKHVLIKKKTFSIATYIFHRLWRIYPVYIFVILYSFIMEITCSGPSAHDTVKYFTDGCKRNWWTNLLFINNFYNASDLCFSHTWYLSVDFQLYAASLIILLPLFRWPNVGMGIAVVSLVGSVVTCAAVTYIKNLPPTFLLATPNLERMTTFGTQFYVMPYVHAGPYIVGLIAGYLLAMNPNLKITKLVQLMGWTCSIIFSLSSVYGIYAWNTGIEQIPWETAFYAGCHRVAWTLSVAWMVICCATGYGGIVNYILSWKAWVILGRLTFTAYLVHPLLQFSILTSLRGPLDSLHASAVWIYFGHLMGTYGVAFAVTILIESPSFSIEKLILPKQEEETPRKAEINASQMLDSVEVRDGKDKCILNRSCNGLQGSQRQISGIENSGFLYTYKL